MAAQPRLQKDSDSKVQPFSFKAAPLGEFVREYESVSGVPIDIAGGWSDLSGQVSVIMRQPVSLEGLNEIFHLVLGENGFSAIEASGNAGWKIVKQRDARDMVIPLHDSTDSPDSYRMITVIHAFNNPVAEEASRFMRSFMPANSRIIPVTSSQVAITDSGRNIKKLMKLAAFLDTEATAKASQARAEKSRNQQKCEDPTQKIGSLVVEKLEIKGTGSDAPFSIPQNKGARQ